MPVDILIPARNEAETIGPLIRSLYGDMPPDLHHKNVSKIIVVDNGSGDDTGKIAEDAGALVVRCEDVGKGQAISAGLKHVITGRVLLCDGDLTPFKPVQVWLMTLPWRGMVIGVPDYTENVPWSVDGALWKRLSGVRNIPVGMLTDLRDQGLLYGYTVEVMLNMMAKKRMTKTRMIPLYGVKGKVKWGDERRAAIVDDMGWMAGRDLAGLEDERKEV